MKKKIWSFVLSLALLLACIPLSGEASTTGTVWGGYLMLRDAPSYNGEVLSSWPTGTQVTIRSTVGSWYGVTVPDGTKGYMLAKWLKTGGSTPSSGESAVIVSSNGKNVRLRSGPGTAYSILASYASGTSCTILSSGSYWSCIQVGSTTGYMMNQYLKTSGVTPTAAPTASPQGEYTVYVTSKNGQGVNLRSGAGKDYTQIGFYSVGTQATMVLWGKTWSFIRIGTRSGYMMTEFLTQTAPATPVVGAPVVTSANGRSVNLRSGAGKGYSVVDSFPVGTRVTILSRGSVWHYVCINGYYGYMMAEFIAETTTPVTPTATPTAVPTVTPVPVIVKKGLTGCVLTVNGSLAPGCQITAHVLPETAADQVSYAWYWDTGEKLSCTSSVYTLSALDAGHYLRCVVTALESGNYTGSASSSYTGHPATSTDLN